MPPLHAVRVFEAAARHLSMSAAARELFITQGAVSQQVRNLEGYLQLELFVRGRNGLALTDAGKIFYEAIAPAIRAIATASSRVKRLAVGAEVTISTVASVAARWLLPRLSGLESALGGTPVRIEICRDVVDFRERDLDLALRYGDGQWEGVEARPLFALEVACVHAPDLRLPAGRLPDAVLHSDARLLHDARHPYWGAWAARQGFPEEHLRARYLRIDDMNVLIDAALDGRGVAMVPGFLVQEDIEAGRLTRLEGDPLALPGGLWLVTPHGRIQRQAVQRAIEWLLDAAESASAETPAPPRAARSSHRL